MTTKTADEFRQKKARLERALSWQCDFPVEITYRGLELLTLSADGRRNWDKAVAFMADGGRVSEVEEHYDEECDLSCLYLRFVRVTE